MGDGVGQLTAVIESVPFCYGPASIGVAIARELRAAVPREALRLVALGDGTAYEFFNATDVFDEVHRFRLADLQIPHTRSVECLRRAALVLTVADFAFARAMHARGCPATLIDPLYWMWDHDPIPLRLCREYYVTNFPGVVNRVAAYMRQHPGGPSPILVDPIRDEASIRTLSECPPSRELLMNFGGVLSPLGWNLDLTTAVAQGAIEVALSLGLHDAILICGGGAALTEVARRIEIRDARVQIGPIEQREFFRHLSSCRDFLTVPGLSIICEAIAFNKKTLLLPPLNYSQHGQLRVFRRVLENAGFVSFNGVEGDGLLPPGLPEASGVEKALELGRRFAKDRDANAIYHAELAAFLTSSMRGIGLDPHADTSLGTFNGARQIAGRLLDADARGCTLWQCVG